jgi:hypothetical protein
VHGLTKITVTGLVVFAAVSGTAAAQDFRSPDARDSARQVTRATGPSGRDLVPPYTRFETAQVGSSKTDLRSPDARDASTHPVTTYVPGRVLNASRPAPAAPANAFSWGDAGIGAAGMLALVALFAGTLMIVSPRRRGRRFPVATR